METNSTILLINAETAQLRSYALKLRDLGFNVLISINYTQALDIASKKNPAALVFFIGENDNPNEDHAFRKITQLSVRFIFIDPLGKIKNETKLLHDNKHYFPYLINEAELVSVFKSEDSISYSGKDVSTKKILVVEDERLNQLLLKEIITELNIRHKVVSTYVEAFAELETKTYDLVISDAKLPDGNGIDLLRKFSATDLGFFIVSGHTKVELIERYGNFSCHKMITKPIEPYTVSKVICSFLGLNASEKPAATNESATKQYNPERVFKLFNNNVQEIENCFRSFIEYLSSVSASAKKVLLSGNVNEINQALHDVTNLCIYFDANYLLDLIKEYRDAEYTTTKINLVPKIKNEAEQLLSFYKNYNVIFS